MHFLAIQQTVAEWKEKKVASLNSEIEEKVEEEEENIYSVTLDDNVSEYLYVNTYFLIGISGLVFSTYRY